MGGITLAPLLVEIKTNIQGFKQQMENVSKTATDEANKVAKEFTKVANVGEKLKDVGGKLTMGLTLPLAGVGVAAGKLASDFNESLNKVQVAFGDSSKEVEKWSKTTLNSFGIAQGTALDMASLFGDMGTSMGLTTGEASKMSTSMVGLAGDLASFKNISVERAQTALAGIFTGETEALKSLGVVMTQTNLEQFAMEKGINKTMKEMTEAEKIQLRYAYVMEKTKNAQGDFARTSDGTANSSRVAKESLKELGATIGQQILPMVTPLIQKFTELVKSFSNMDESSKKLIVVLGLVGASIGPVLSIVGSAIGVFSKLKIAFAAISAMATTAGVSVGAFLLPVALVIGAVALMAIAIATNFGGIRDSISSVMQSISEIISSVITIIKSLWENNFMGIKTLTEGIFNHIRLVFKTVFDAIADIFKIFSALFKGDWEGVWNGIKDFVTHLWDNIKSIFANFLNMLVDVLLNIGVILFNAAVTVFTKLKDGFVHTWGVIKEWFSKAIEDPIGTIKGIGSAMFDAGKTIFTFLWDGIKSVWTGIKNWVSDKVNWLKDKVMFWKSSKEEMEDGSHYNGLSYVPFDGYLARLHKGEAVLTAEENKNYAQGNIQAQGNGITLTIGNFNNNRKQDIRELAEELEFYRRQKTAW